MIRTRRLRVLDLFCGAGGLSYGLRSAGLDIRLGIDTNGTALATYARNLSGGVLHQDVAAVTRDDVAAFFDGSGPDVLAGGPPCQLFSRLHKKRTPQSPTVRAYLRLVAALTPAFVVMENVPNMASLPLWGRFVKKMNLLGYNLWWGTVDFPRLGLPQKRQRLLLLGSRTQLLVPTWRSASRSSSVREAIGDLPEQSDSIPNHITMNLSDENLRRLRSTPLDGGRSRTGATFADSYSRMAWDSPAPTITTRCISFSNGRFGHPEFHRAITVREAARLQGFPDSFRFDGGVWEAARQVGNAVPPILGKRIGQLLARTTSQRPASIAAPSSSVRERGRLLVPE